MLFLRAYDSAQDLTLHVCGSFWPGARDGVPVPPGYPDHVSRVSIDGKRWCGCGHPVDSVPGGGEVCPRAAPREAS